MERIVKAAETILRDKTFDQATVSEIARAAEVTTGAFYGRFPDKESLFQYLSQKAPMQLQSDMDETFSREFSNQAEYLEAVFNTLASFYESYKGVVRSVVHRSRLDSPHKRRRQKFNDQLIDQIIEGFHKHGTKKSGYKPVKLETSLLFAVSAIREAVLFSEFWPENKTPSREYLVSELVNAVLLNLGHKA